MVKEKLSNLYDIGSSKRVFQSEWREEGVPFYRAREIARLSEDGYVNNELFIDEDLYEEYTKKYGKPQPGDVMVTGVGTLGVCYVVKPEDKFYFKDGNILWFKQKAPDRILPEYLVKAFDSKEVKEFISKNSSGTTVGTFTIQTANKMEISLPTLNQQKEIIERISKLEGIIKKRQLEIEKLDELIKARFVELFGDVKDNPNNYPLCEIKKVVKSCEAGWSANGTQRDKREGEVAVLKVSAVTKGYFIPEECKVLDDQENIKKRVTPQKGDLIFSRANTREMVGATAIVREDYPELILPDKLWKIRFTDAADVFYMKHVLSSKHIREQFSAASTGTSGSMYNVSMEKFYSIKIPMPPRNEQMTFREFVEQIDKSRVAVQKALDETKMLFDSLMQQYFG